MAAYDSIMRPLLSWNRELSDPSWRRWFDTLKEQGVDKLADNSVGVARGMWSAPEPDKPTFDPRYQSSSFRDVTQGDDGSYAIQRRHSNSIGSPNPSLSGIYRATNAPDPNGAIARQDNYMTRRAGRRRAT